MSKLYSGTIVVLATLTPRPGKLQAVSYRILFLYSQSAHVVVMLTITRFSTLHNQLFSMHKTMKKVALNFRFSLK